ncbi:heparan-alpha-glucosaminide N-acetyltransferase domain-containing protein [Micrococcus lacusdianchii]|uniref:heparan-alpha-glucosaminide N-acetyltransferase domain-containing protein n=1 Tax=Micrococcus lacusdianchii TaxID=2915940 RepID=UPI0020046D79|nr:heparan-alpha-glucosaminide N-acetyltransferase domain-containing protein [Micrococcus sp. JXJ CY 30]
MPVLPHRLTGVDAARGVALLGLAAVHVTDPATAAGHPDPLHLVFSGGAAALFVTLAGVGLALAAGGPEPVPATAAAVLRRRTLRRAGVLFVLGLVCGALGTPVAVILCHYALLFLLALPLLRLRGGALAALAGAWLVLGPVLVFGLRAAGQALLGREEFLQGARLWTSPAPTDLATPALLLTDLLVTGYYPVLSWGAFLVAGLAIGRLDLRAPRTAALLAVGGVGAGAAALGVGAAVRGADGVVARIAAATGAAPEELATTLLTGEHRLAWLIPDPLWLALATPHGGSPLEAVRALGWAVAVLGLCLLLSRRRGRAPGAGVLPGVGRLSLTLYVGHLVLLGALMAAGVPFRGLAAAAVLWMLFLAAGWAAARTGADGPLETGMRRLARRGEDARPGVGPGPR